MTGPIRSRGRDIRYVADLHLDPSADGRGGTNLIDKVSGGP